MATTSPHPLTEEDLLALREDGMGREMIAGIPRKRLWKPYDPDHARTEARIVTTLINWLNTCPAPRGEVFSGGAGFLLQRDPDTFLGLDIAYIPPDQTTIASRARLFHEGPPTLAIEIRSCHDTFGEIHEKTQALLDSGAPLVWDVDPYLQTVMVLRPDARPVLFNVSQEITAEPHLPGFRAALTRFFET